MAECAGCHADGQRGATGIDLYLRSCAGTLSFRSGAPTTARPQLFLGVGEDDKLLRQAQTAIEVLPPAHVVEVAGHHAWPAFLAIWAQLLDRAPLPRLPERAPGDR